VAEKVSWNPQKHKLLFGNTNTDVACGAIPVKKHWFVGFLRLRAAWHAPIRCMSWR